MPSEPGERRLLKRCNIEALFARDRDAGRKDVGACRVGIVPNVAEAELQVQSDNSSGPAGLDSVGWMGGRRHRMSPASANAAFIRCISPS